MNNRDSTQNTLGRGLSLYPHISTVAVIVQLHTPARPVTDPPIRTIPLTFGQLDVGNSLSLVESVYAWAVGRRSLLYDNHYSPGVLGCSRHGFRPCFQHRLVRTIKTGRSLDFTLSSCTRPEYNLG